MVEACSLNLPHYSMQPGFFGGEWHQGSFTIQIAPGGDTGEYADGLVFLVDDTGYVARHLNERIEVGALVVSPWLAALPALAILVPLDREDVTRTWNQVRAVLGVAFLGAVGWVWWSGATAGVLVRVGRSMALW